MSFRPSSLLLTWLLAVALLLSLGLNVYYLTPRYRSVRSAAEGSTATVVSLDDDDDDDQDDDDDTSWAALTEELRQTRLLLAECQGHALPADTAATLPSL